jgi:hypothetical protein
MMKKYLMVEIEEITPELLERFKASGEWIWISSFIRVRYNSNFGRWQDAQGYYTKTPTHYLPDGLPDPSAAVEVFESEANQDYTAEDYGEGLYGSYIAELPQEMLETVTEGTKLGVFKL